MMTENWQRINVIVNANGYNEFSVVVYSQQPGLFGDVLDTAAVLALPSLRTICGRRRSEAGRALPADIPARISNHSSSFLRLHWVDAEGRALPCHALTLALKEECNRHGPESVI